MASTPLKQAGLLLAYSAPAGNTVEDPSDGGLNPFTSRLIENLLTKGLKPGDVFSRSQAAFSANAVADFYLTGAPDPIIQKIELKPGQPRVNPNVPSLSDAWIPPGTFQMGCVQQDKQCSADENPRHAVTISKGFWITSTEVTVEAYNGFLERTGYNKKPRDTKTNRKGLVNSSPQTEVSWRDAQEFCWAGGRRSPAHREAEWSTPPRGKRRGPFFPRSDSPEKDNANSNETSKKKRGKYEETTPVRYFGNPNGVGLFDIAGNVREWVLDAYDAHAYEGAAPFTDPITELGPKNERVLHIGEPGKPVLCDLRLFPYAATRPTM